MALGISLADVLSHPICVGRIPEVGTVLRWRPSMRSEPTFPSYPFTQQRHPMSAICSHFDHPFNSPDAHKK